MKKEEKNKIYLLYENMPGLNEDRLISVYLKKEEAEKEAERLNSKSFDSAYYILTDIRKNEN